MFIKTMLQFQCIFDALFQTVSIPLITTVYVSTPGPCEYFITMMCCHSATAVMPQENDLSVTYRFHQFILSERVYLMRPHTALHGQGLSPAQCEIKSKDSHKPTALHEVDNILHKILTTEPSRIHYLSSAIVNLGEQKAISDCILYIFCIN